MGYKVKLLALAFDLVLDIDDVLKCHMRVQLAVAHDLAHDAVRAVAAHDHLRIGSVRHSVCLPERSRAIKG